MASVYILYFRNLNRFYTGSCNNLPQRLEQHFNKDFEDSFTTKADD
ncbi:GIY-YIG nuclease family protein [Pedobacter psychrodurus]